LLADLTLIDRDFQQTTGSCVLASYAIVANYFTQIPVSEFFAAYCRHFSIFSPAFDSEHTYADHFSREINKSPDSNGYKLILSLHNNSSDNVFAEARRLFSAKFYLNAAYDFCELEESLESSESLLNLTYGRMVQTGALFNNSIRSQLICHSVTIFNHDGSLFIRDSDRCVNTNLYSINFLHQLAETRDAVLYTKI